jgi:hypothetical protein
MPSTLPLCHTPDMLRLLDEPKIPQGEVSPENQRAFTIESCYWERHSVATGVFWELGFCWWEGGIHWAANYSHGYGGSIGPVFRTAQRAMDYGEARSSAIADLIKRLDMRYCADGDRHRRILLLDVTAHG